jgi:hypothetical protein
MNRDSHNCLSLRIANDIMRRVKDGEVRTFSEHFPDVEPGCLLAGKGSGRLQEVWDTSGTEHVSSRRWIY